VQSMFRRCRYITLVNLLTAEDIATARPAAIYDRGNPRDAHALMPEYLTHGDRSEQLAAHCVEWLTDSKARSRHIARMVELRNQFAAGGASERAAEYIAEVLRPAEEPSRQAA
jgi:lipid-A-disaccharide synthase